MKNFPTMKHFIAFGVLVLLLGISSLWIFINELALDEEIAKADKLATEYISLPQIIDGGTVAEQQIIRQQRQNKKSELQNQYELIIAFGGGNDIRVKILQALYPTESQQNLKHLSSLSFISLVNYSRKVAWTSKLSCSDGDNTVKIAKRLSFIQADAEKDALFSVIRNGLIDQHTGIDRFKNDIQRWRPYIEESVTPQQVELIDRHYISEITNGGKVGPLFDKESEEYIVKESCRFLELTKWINSDIALDLVESLNLGERILNTPESEDTKAFQRAIVSISEKAIENPERVETFKLAIKEKVRNGIIFQEIEKTFNKTWDKTK